MPHERFLEEKVGSYGKGMAGKDLNMKSEGDSAHAHFVDPSEAVKEFGPLFIFTAAIAQKAVCRKKSCAAQHSASDISMSLLPYHCWMAHAIKVLFCSTGSMFVVQKPADGGMLLVQPLHSSRLCNSLINLCSSRHFNHLTKHNYLCVIQIPADGGMVILEQAQ
eukprot:scaffold191209_cov20-Tisochrysis_lutea.AAC.1